MKRHLVLGTVVLLGLGGYASDLFADDQEALKAFGTVQKVFQSPRCRTVTFPVIRHCSLTPASPTP